MGLPVVAVYVVCTAPSGVALCGWPGNGACDGSGNSTWNVTVSPGLKPVPMRVNFVPTGPWGGRISMLATGFGSVVGAADVVVVFDPPPPPHATRLVNAKTTAAVAGHSRDRFRM